MAQIVYEALQFCKIVPNRIESDIRELERAIDLYSSLQDKLDRMSTIKNYNIEGEEGIQSLDNSSLSGLQAFGGQGDLHHEDRFVHKTNQSNGGVANVAYM